MRHRVFSVTTHSPRRTCRWQNCNLRIATTCHATRCPRRGWHEQGHGLRESGLQDAVKRCLDLRGELGVHALLADALHNSAAAPYRLHGFHETAENALTLYLPLGKVLKTRTMGRRPY